eukprot:Skav216630  [mRNA]  locus=scaffold1255:1189:1920:+ [translate_table: standard]
MQPLCNKCRQGFAAEGDSWCIGCSALEHSQRLLRAGWYHPGLRRVAEESLLSAARLAKAFSSLDFTLRQESAPSTAPKSRPERRSRSPLRSHRGDREPAAPARLREAPRDRDPPREDLRERDHPPARREPTGDTDNSSAEDEGEEEERSEERCREDERTRTSRGSERPPEPPRPPLARERRAEEVTPKRKAPGRKKKKKKRGGAKHQRHSKTGANPFRRTHRSLNPADLGLATSFHGGLNRRA